MKLKQLKQTVTNKANTIANDLAIKMNLKEKEIKIQISDLLVQRLQSLGNNKVAKMILEMSKGLTESQLRSLPNCPNYLDFKDNNITFINESAIKRNNVTNPWDNNSRQSTPAVRIIRRILSAKYVDSKLKNTDIENFVYEWNASLDKSTTIKVLRGWDVLKAFNYHKDITPQFGRSCANFNQKDNGYDEPMIKWFYFYIYNPENISVVTVWNKGKLKARSVMFEGIQLKDSGKYKKGEHYNFLNLMYGEGDGKWKAMIKQWATENGYIFGNRDLKADENMGGYYYFNVKTHYKTYPPVDSQYVNVKEDILTNSSNEYYSVGGRDKGWKEAYKLRQNGGNHLSKNKVA